MPAVMASGKGAYCYAELDVSSPAVAANHHQYSLHLPTEGWPGWVGLDKFTKVTNPSTNRALHSLTLLMWPKPGAFKGNPATQNASRKSWETKNKEVRGDKIYIFVSREN